MQRICLNCGKTFISIHAPRAGCDYGRRKIAPGIAYFNPRTPGGVRLLPPKIDVGPIFISIHAPQAGCDASSARSASLDWLFQSTHPRRGAIMPSRLNGRFSAFQSTHPRRGAMPVPPYLKPSGVFQSTHPRRGAIDAGACIILWTCNFNPRTPGGVR